jgi:glutaredoxin
MPRFPFNRRRPIREVTLYGKPGCHLCEDTRALLARLERRHPMRVTEVDITADRELFRRYDIRIPVIVIDGGAEIDAPIDERTLRRALDQEAAR